MPKKYEKVIVRREFAKPHTTFIIFPETLQHGSCEAFDGYNYIQVSYPYIINVTRVISNSEARKIVTAFAKKHIGDYKIIKKFSASQRREYLHKGDYFAVPK